MNTDQQRADFEAWARELTPNINLGRYPNEGTYVVTAVERAWRVWQAALTSPQVQALHHDLEQYIGIASELASENEALRVALEMIAGMRPCPDSLMGNADIARAALAAMENQP